MLSPGEDPAHPESGTLVGPGVNAQHHQHMFAVRIDPAIDDAEGGKGVVVSEARIFTPPRCAALSLSRGGGGPAAPLPAPADTPLTPIHNPPTARPQTPPNTPCNVTQVDVVALPPGPDNPYGNGAVAIESDLTTVHGAQRVIAPEKGRVWKFKNPASLNPVTGAPRLRPCCFGGRGGGAVHINCLSASKPAHPNFFKAVLTAHHCRRRRRRPRSHPPNPLIFLPNRTAPSPAQASRWPTSWRRWRTRRCWHLPIR